MKLNNKILKLLIAVIYVTALFLSVSSIGIEIIDTIRRSLTVILPGIITILILYDNRKDLKKLLTYKVPFVLYILTIIWLFLTFIFGIKTGIESFKGLVHFGTLFTFMFVLFNLKLTEEQKKQLKKHIFIVFSVVMILGTIQYIFKINLNTYNNDKYPGILGRINSTFYIATLLDKYIVAMFALITYELLKDKDNNYYRILIILATLGVTFTFSRSGQFIFLVMAFIFFVVTLIKKQFKNSILIILCILGMLVIPGSKYSVQSSLDYAYEAAHVPKVMQVNVIKIFSIPVATKEGNKPSIKHVEAGKCADDDCVGDLEGSMFFRDYYKRVGMQLLKEYPIFGIGVGNNYYLYVNQNAKDYLVKKDVISDEYKYMYPHSGYIQLAAEIGYIGITLVISYLLSMIVTKIINKKELFDIYPLLMLCFAFALGNITEGLFHSKQYIYLFAVFFTLYCNPYKQKIKKAKK